MRKKWWEICSHYYKNYKITAVVPNQYNSGIDLWSGELSDLYVKAVCSFIILLSIFAIKTPPFLLIHIYYIVIIIEDLRQQNT